MGRSSWFYTTIIVSIIAIFALLVAFGTLLAYVITRTSDQSLQSIDKELQSAIENAGVEVLDLGPMPSEEKGPIISFHIRCQFIIEIQIWKLILSFLPFNFV